MLISWANLEQCDISVYTPSDIKNSYLDSDYTINADNWDTIMKTLSTSTTYFAESTGLGTTSTNEQTANKTLPTSVSLGVDGMEPYNVIPTTGSIYL